MKIPANIEVGLGLGVLVIGAIWLLSRNGQGIAQAIASTAAGAVTGVAKGTVIGVGQAVGIPDTDRQKCDAAIMNRNGLDASFYCPAGEYVQYLAGTHPLLKLPLKQAAPGTITIDQLTNALGEGDPRIPSLGTGGVVSPGIPASQSSKRAPKPITVIDAPLGGSFADQSTGPIQLW